MRSTTERPLVFGLAFAAVLLVACEDHGAPTEGPVDFDSEGAVAARHAACMQDFEAGARKGAGAEEVNASVLWAVSPYQLLIPATGDGFVRLQVDAPHYDWLVYTTADVQITSLDGPELTVRGPVEDCPQLNLVEYGAHHTEKSEWGLLLTGDPRSRARFYAAVVPTDHSDPADAGHAGHGLDGGTDMSDHGMD